MSPEIQRPEPAYIQISRHIHQQILEGELGEGESVPSARQIMQDWDVAMATAMKALDRLKSEGLVRSVPGVGTVVATAESSIQTPKARIGTMRRTGRVYPANERAQIKSAETIEAPPHVAEALGIAAGEPVIRRHRVTFRDDIAVSASVSWFHGDLARRAPRLLSTERILKGTFGYIEEVTGRPLAGGTDQKAASTATQQDAADLGIEVGAPVLRGRNWMYDQDGGVLEYGESTSRAERWTTYEYEITN